MRRVVRSLLALVVLAVFGLAIGVGSASASAVIATIKVGNGPSGVSSDGTHVWVANETDDTVSEIVALTGKVAKTISVPPVYAPPVGVSSDGTHAWVTNDGAGNAVTEIDASTGTVVKTIQVDTCSNFGSPYEVSSDGTHVWVTIPKCTVVSEVNASSGTFVQTISVGTNPSGVSSDKTHVWVANESDNTVTEIKASTGTFVKAISVGRAPAGVSSDGTDVWVANQSDNTVSEINASTGTVVNTIRVGSVPTAVSSDGIHVWVANTGDNTVSELDALTGAIVQTISVGSGPSAVSSDGTHAWVTNSGDGTVSEIAISKKTTPTVSVTDDSAGVVTGGSFTYTAKVTGTGGVTPTGAMTWTVTGPDGGSVPCASPTGPTGSGDVATYTCTVADAAAGTYMVTAAYPGNSDYTPVSVEDDTAAVAKATPTMFLGDDAKPDTPGSAVTFTAVVVGNGGLAPMGDASWTVTAPGGATQSCDSMPSPTDSGPIATYTCTVARSHAARAMASYPGDPNYNAVADSHTTGTSSWDSPDISGPSFEPVSAIYGVALLRIQHDTSLSLSGVASNIFIPPAITAVVPLFVRASIPTGTATVNLQTGEITGPATLTADPPYPGPPAGKPLTALEVLLSIPFHAEGGFIAIPIGKTSRTLTLAFTDVFPASFVATLKDDVTTSVSVNDAVLVALAVAVRAPQILAVAVPALEGALSAEGPAVAPGVISDALSTILKRFGGGVTSRSLPVIPTGLAARAAALWASLKPTSGARATMADATPTPATSPAAVVARVKPLRAVDLHGLRAQRLRGALAKAAEASLLTLPTNTKIGRLVESQRLPPGGRALTLLGGDLAGTKAEIVIAGPGYTAVRDVRINHGLAGGRVILPPKRRAGRWYAGIIDYNALHAAHGSLIGRTILEAATWNVP